MGLWFIAALALGLFLVPPASSRRELQVKGRRWFLERSGPYLILVAPAGCCGLPCDLPVLLFLDGERRVLKGRYPDVPSGVYAQAVADFGIVEE